MSAVILACLMLIAPAQNCARCKGEAVVACAKHPKGIPELEQGVLFCSHPSRCAACQGTLKAKCPDCKTAPKEGALADARESAQAKIARQASFEKEMGGVPRLTMQSERFQLTFEVESMTVGKRVLEQHELAHLYLARLEKLKAEFDELFGLQPRDHKCKLFRVMVWKLQLDQKEASTRYTGGTSLDGSKMLGTSGVFSLFRERGKLPQDDDLHRSITHNVTHLLLADLFDCVWLGKKKAGWVDEGLAHWFEDRGFGVCTNFCYQEQNSNVSFRGGKWRQPVRAMVESGKMPSFAETGNKMTDELKLEEHALAFSYVDFLIARDAKAFPKMVRVIQQKDKATRDGLKEAYGLSMFEFEENWKRWVLENYKER